MMELWGYPMGVLTLSWYNFDNLLCPVGLCVLIKRGGLAWPRLFRHLDGSPGPAIGLIAALWRRAIPHITAAEIDRLSLIVFQIALYLHSETDPCNIFSDMAPLLRDLQSIAFDLAAREYGKTAGQWAEREFKTKLSLLGPKFSNAARVVGAGIRSRGSAEDADSGTRSKHARAPIVCRHCNATVDDLRDHLEKCEKAPKQKSQKRRR
jgi:hypothetical protein